MIRLCLAVTLAVLSSLAAELQAAPIWKEVKVNNLSYVTFESFCQFYEFDNVAVPEKDPFTIKGIYGSLTLKANSREAFYNGGRIWLSFPFIRGENGEAFVSRMDVIKLLDPLLRREEMAPRKPVRGVVIDPGHGGSNDGTRSCPRYYEKVATLDTAKRLQQVLQAAKIPVVMTRETDVFLTLEERSEIANKYRDEGWIFVSIHYNEAGPNANGAETYCLTPQYTASTSDGDRLKKSDREQQPGNKNDTLNLLLADFVHREIAKLHTEQGDRGLKRARFVVLKETEIPAILIEGGFLSNSVDSKLIMSPVFRQKLAENIAKGIKNYMALMTSPKGKAPTVIQPAAPKFRAPTAVPAPKQEAKTEPPPVPKTQAPTPPSEPEKQPESKPKTTEPKPSPVISTTSVPVVPNLQEISRPTASPPPESPAPQEDKSKDAQEVVPANDQPAAQSTSSGTSANVEESANHQH